MTSAILHPHVILYSSIQDPVYSILLASTWDGGCWSVPREWARYPKLGVFPQHGQPGKPAQLASPVSQQAVKNLVNPYILMTSAILHLLCPACIQLG